MSRTDERIREEIRRLADPPDPAGALARVERLVARRAVARRAQTAGLAVVVVAGTVLGVLGLSRIFRQPEGEPLLPGIERGEWRILFSGWTASPDLYGITPEGTIERISRNPGVDTDPAWSPDGTRIAFASGTNPNDEGLDIYVMAADGSNVRRLTHDPQLDDFSPAWSPDGSQIAFTRSAGGDWALFVMDADGSRLRRITDSSFLMAADPAWSPDGTRIAFAGALDPDHDIFVIAPDGSGQMRLSDRGGAANPAWSPDGTRIAFDSDEHQGSQERRNVYVMNADGSDIVRLTSTPGHNFAPTWSPDGRSILFASSRAHPLASMILGADLYLMDADGSNVRRLTTIGGVGYSPNAGGKAAWLPTDPPDESPPASVTPAEACDESTVRGDFDDDGQPDTATVLRARCSALAEPAGWAIELEWSTSKQRGGGTLAAGAWPVRECIEWCQALAAPDLDGDGRDELAIQTVAFSIHIFHVYTALPFATGPVPLRVAPPGDPEGGFDPGAAPTFSAGGDAFWTYNIRCNQGTEGRVIVVTAAESLPHDSPDAVWHVHETVLRLTGADPSNAPEPISGEFEVVSVRTYTVPTEDPQQRSLFFDYTDLCGAPIATGAPA